jgi:hypothetical protein
MKLSHRSRRLLFALAIIALASAGVLGSGRAPLVVAQDAPPRPKPPIRQTSPTSICRCPTSSSSTDLTAAIDGSAIMGGAASRLSGHHSPSPTYHECTAKVGG